MGRGEKGGGEGMMEVFLPTEDRFPLFQAIELFFLRKAYFHNRFHGRVAKNCWCDGLSSRTSIVCPIHGSTTPFRAGYKFLEE